ncbi:MAG: class I SAM-dependent methyltransferase [Acidobacteria bacterium]|nr:MAG: class I SAM-dependent methyltransferase [Acidobacteriota bacterium]
MNFSHSSLTDWGLNHIQIEPQFMILDVGCGGGRTIQKMAAIATEGQLYGIDYSAESVATSRAKNRSLIQVGRVEIQQASVSELPFPDNHFDLVTAIETHYYWPDLVNDMREILRVLKPGAIFLLIAESYKGGKYEWVHGPVMKLLKSTRLSADELRESFAAAGFSESQTFEEIRHGWLCGLGRKPLEK